LHYAFFNSRQSAATSETGYMPPIIRKWARSCFSPDQRAWIRTAIHGTRRFKKKLRRKVLKFLGPYAVRIRLPSGRRWRSAMPVELINSFSEGAKNYKYCGLRCVKFPTELALYTLLISKLRPRTIIEIGTQEGGGALWMADQIRTFGIEGRVISIDKNPPSPFYEKDRTDIVLLRGDAGRLEDCLSSDFLASLARPWLIIEDSSHKFQYTIAVLRFFDRKLQPGEYIVVEDGVVSDIGRGDEFQGGPGRAISQFLSEAGGRYEIDEELCDFFGHNVTSNPNGYLIRR
jgi:cephalosporin hydroxylase